MCEFLNNNLNLFYLNTTDPDSWCVTKSLTDGEVFWNSENSLPVLEHAGIPLHGNQFEAMRFKYPQLYKTCIDARDYVVRTGHMKAFQAPFIDRSTLYPDGAETIVIYQLWRYHDRFAANFPDYHHEFEGDYFAIAERMINKKLDVLTCWWKLIP
jgi:hypothetical protein